MYTIIPLGFFIQSFALPAWVMLIYWMLLQFFGGVTSIVAERSGGVAFWAHIGGFIAGLALIKIFERRDHLAAHTAGEWRPNDWDRW